MARPKIVRKAGGKSGPSMLVQPGTSNLEAITADTVTYQELFQARMIQAQVEAETIGSLTPKLKQMIKDYYSEAMKREASTYQIMLRNQERKLAAKYAQLVGTALTNSNLLTLRQLHQIQSTAFAAAMRQFEEAVQKTFLSLNNQVQRDLMYRQAVEKINTQGFKLYVVTDNPEANEVIQHLLGVSETVKNICEPLVYHALWTAFNRAWKGLTEDQFPKRYKALVRLVIRKLRARKAIVIHGSGPKTWELSLDFADLFGDWADLKRGSHFGALIGQEGVKSLMDDLNYEQNMAKENRVKLPYSKQRLKNKWYVRYRFWKALWEGKDYYPELHEGSTDDEARKSLGEKHQKRLAAVDANIKIITNKKFGRRYQPSQLFDSSRSFKADKTYIQRKRNLQRLEREKSRLTDRINSGEAGAKSIPTDGLREATIRARTAFWLSIGKAPFWWFLEFGQFKYAPIIPPRGLTFIFQGIMNEVVTQTTNRVYHRVVKKYTTDTKGGATGRNRLAAKANVEQLSFTGINPNTKPGGFLPKNLIEQQRSVLESIAYVRRAAEAEAMSGTMGAGDTGGRYTEDVIDKYISDAIFKKSLGPSKFRPSYARSKSGKFSFPQYNEWASQLRASHGYTPQQLPDSNTMRQYYASERAKALETWEEIQIQNDMIKLLKEAEDL
jgi:hypothetical protein